MMADLIPTFLLSSATLVEKRSFPMSELAVWRNMSFWSYRVAFTDYFGLQWIMEGCFSLDPSRGGGHILVAIIICVKNAKNRGNGLHCRHQNDNNNHFFQSDLGNWWQNFRGNNDKDKDKLSPCLVQALEEKGRPLREKEVRLDKSRQRPEVGIRGWS